MAPPLIFGRPCAGGLADVIWREPAARCHAGWAQSSQRTMRNYCCSENAGKDYFCHSEGELIIRCHSEGAKRPKNPPVGSAVVTTTLLKHCCHSRASRGNPTVGSSTVAATLLKHCCHSRAPRGNPTVGSSMVAATHSQPLLSFRGSQRRPKNPPNGSAVVTTTLLKHCCHSRAPRGNPTVGSSTVAATHSQPLLSFRGSRRRPKNPPDGLYR